MQEKEAMRKEEIPPREALGLLEPSPLVLVTTEVRGNPNVSTCSWVMPAGPAPPTVALSLSPESLTRRNVEERGEFILNIPGRGLAREVAFCGGVSGAEVRKIRECGLRLEPGGKVRAPILTDCLAHLECSVLEARGAGGNVLYTAEIILAVAGRDLFVAGRGWNLENLEARFLLHLGGPCYASPDRVMELDPMRGPVR
jgi:flavin reductase (DIM6/NTAB) family NADH-FMN oxidoreductase RutF